MSKELFLEIGTEEIPAGFLPRAMADMEGIIAKELSSARLAFGEIRTFATPRRLAMVVKEVSPVQPDAEITDTGPAVNVAFDAEGGLTRAGEGFLRGKGWDGSPLRLDAGILSPGVIGGFHNAKIELIDTGKVLKIAVTRTETGRPAHELLSEILPRLIAGIPFRKSMRWGSGEATFGRPVQWLVALFGSDVVDVEFNGIRGGRQAAQRFIESVKMASHLANIGDAKSLIIHPASTTHRQLTDEQRVAAGAGPDVLRLSIGIETVDDIIADLIRSVAAK